MSPAARTTRNRCLECSQTHQASRKRPCARGRLVHRTPNRVGCDPALGTGPRFRERGHIFVLSVRGHGDKFDPPQNWRMAGDAALIEAHHLGVSCNLNDGRRPDHAAKLAHDVPEVYDGL